MRNLPERSKESKVYWIQGMRSQDISIREAKYQQISFHARHTRPLGTHVGDCKLTTRSSATVIIQRANVKFPGRRTRKEIQHLPVEKEEAEPCARYLSVKEKGEEKKKKDF